MQLASIMDLPIQKARPFSQDSESATFGRYFFNVLSWLRGSLAVYSPGSKRLYLYFLVCIVTLASPLTRAYASGQMLAENPHESTIAVLENLEHSVSVKVYEDYAITTVKQTFYNPEKTNLQGRFHFRLPKKSVLSGITARTNGVVVSSQSRTRYGQNISRLKLSAQQNTTIELIYIQRIVATNGVARYSYESIEPEPGSLDSVDSKYLSYLKLINSHLSKKNQSTNVAFTLELDSSVSVAAIWLTAQTQGEISRSSDNTWLVSVPAQATNTAVENEEFASDQCNPGNSHENGQLLTEENSINVHWCFDNDAPASLNMRSWQSAEEESGTFLMTLAPGSDLKPIVSGRDWIFVLDSSGSMKDRYKMLTKGVERALQNLQASDRFRIINFNDRTTEPSNGWRYYSDESTDDLLEQLRQVETSGGTDFIAAMKHSFSILDPVRTSAVVFITDGETNIGSVEKKAFLQLMEKFDIRLFTFVLGNDSSRPLLKKMADRSNGRAIKISNAGKLAEQLPEITKLVTHSALRDLSFEVNGVPSRLGIIKDTPIADSPGNQSRSLFKGQQLTIMGHFTTNETIDVKVQGRIGGKLQQYQKQFTRHDLKTNNSTHPIKGLATYHQRLGVEDIADYLGDASEYLEAISQLTTNQTAIPYEVAEAEAEAELSLNPVAGGGVAGYFLLLLLPGLGFIRRCHAQPL